MENPLLDMQGLPPFSRIAPSTWSTGAWGGAAAAAVPAVEEGAGPPDAETSLRDDLGVAGRLMSRGEYESALQILDTNYKAHPEDDALDVVMQYEFSPNPLRRVRAAWDALGREPDRFITRLGLCHTNLLQHRRSQLDDFELGDIAIVFVQALGLDIEQTRGIDRDPGLGV